MRARNLKGALARGALATGMRAGAGASRVAAVAAVSAGVLALLTAAGTVQAQAQEARVQFDIAAQPLPAALRAFASQARQQLLFEEDKLARLRAPALSGSYTPREALERLLAGTGIVATPSSPGFFTLKDAPVATGADLPTVTVTATGDNASEGTGSYAARASSSATRMNLSLRETPQSVSVITRQQMDDQGLRSISDALQQTPGITVSRDNTEGYSFYSRGFQVQNFQFDGVPSLSSDGGNVRDNYSLTDSVIYDRVEILKGATGLVNGAGYPSGVINFVRKRPTAGFQGHASIGAGSWDNYRTELDVSGPLSSDGRIRGRLVAAAQDNRSFIDHLKNRQELVYGIVEADLAPATTLAVGFDVQKNRNNATTNSNLPAFYSNGTPARFGRSTNAGDIWAYRNHDTQRIFATLDHHFGGGWNLKANLGQRDYTSREVISGMASATVNALTHSVAHGFYAGGAARFDTDSNEKSLDLQLSGDYTLFGRKHQVVLGYNTARTHAVSTRSDGDTDALIADAFHWNNNARQPAFYEWWSTFDVNARQKIGYAATVLKPTERLSLILGARVTDYSWSLDSVNANNVRSRTATQVDGKVIPYAGVTYDVDGRHTVYGSFTDVFKPQAYNFDASNRQLAPLTGKSFEIGAKGSYFDKRLNASAAIFELQQDNLAQLDPSGARRPDGGVAYVAIQGVTTQGIELEVSGELQPGWQLNAGFVYARPRDLAGARVSTTQPEKSFKLATMYRLPGAWRRVSIGGNVQWQSGIYFTQTVAGSPRRFEQPAFAVAGLAVNVELAHNLRATLNIHNITDRKYYAGIGNYNSVFYGAPRSVSANLRYDF